MSILNKFKNFYLISHENYINTIYEKNKNNKNIFEVINQETANFKINKQLFEINSVYLKDNQEIYDEIDLPTRKRKRNKKSNETPEEYKDLFETVRTQTFISEYLNKFYSILG